MAEVSETRRAESGVGFLVRGSQPPSHQLECLGERCKRPSGVWDVAPAAKRFSRVLNVQGGLSRHFNVFYCSLFHSSNFCLGCLNGRYGTDTEYASALAIALQHLPYSTFWAPDNRPPLRAVAEYTTR